MKNKLFWSSQIVLLLLMAFSSLSFVRPSLVVKDSKAPFVSVAFHAEKGPISFLSATHGTQYMDHNNLAINDTWNSWDQIFASNGFYRDFQYDDVSLEITIPGPHPSGIIEFRIFGDLDIGIIVPASQSSNSYNYNFKFSDWGLYSVALDVHWK